MSPFSNDAYLNGACHSKQTSVSTSSNRATASGSAAGSTTNPPSGSVKKGTKGKKGNGQSQNGRGYATASQSYSVIGSGAQFWHGDACPAGSYSQDFDLDESK